MTVMARKRLLEKVGGFDESFFTTQDVELWYRLSKITELKYIDESLVCVRRHNRHLSTSNVERKLRDRIRFAKKLIHDEHSLICHANWRRYLVGARYSLAQEVFKNGKHRRATRYLLAILRRNALVGGIRSSEGKFYLFPLINLVNPYMLLYDVARKRREQLRTVTAPENL